MGNDGRRNGADQYNSPVNDVDDDRDTHSFGGLVLTHSTGTHSVYTRAQTHTHTHTKRRELMADVTSFLTLIRELHSECFLSLSTSTSFHNAMTFVVVPASKAWLWLAQPQRHTHTHTHGWLLYLGYLCWRLHSIFVSSVPSNPVPISTVFPRYSSYLTFLFVCVVKARGRVKRTSITFILFIVVQAETFWKTPFDAKR